MRPFVAALGLAVALSGVLSVPGAAQKRDRDRISRDEILESAQKHHDLYQVIRALRPHFLNAVRGTSSLGGGARASTLLVIDGNRSGEIDGLKMIDPESVAEVSYLNPARAEDRFGIRANGGAIVVSLYKRRSPADTSGTR